MVTMGTALTKALHSFIPLDLLRADHIPEPQVLQEPPGGRFVTGAAAAD